MSPQREDYVQRQLKTIAAMIARMVGLRLGGEAEKARAELEQSYTLLLGQQSGLVRQMDVATAARLIGSTAKIDAFAQLLDEEAEQDGDESRSAFLRGRAAEFRQLLEQRDPT